MGCDPKCYINGKGCAISKDGKCIILYAEREKPKIKSFQEAFDEIVKTRTLSNPSNRSYYQDSKYKKKKIAP